MNELETIMFKALVEASCLGTCGWRASGCGGGQDLTE